MSCASVIPAALCAALSGQPTIPADRSGEPLAYSETMDAQPAAMHQARYHRRHYRRHSRRHPPRVIVIRQAATCKPVSTLPATPAVLDYLADATPAAIVRRGFEPFG